MMVNIYGLPPSMDCAEVKSLIKQECELSDFIMSSLILDPANGTVKTRVCLIDDADGNHLIKCLDGYRLSNYVLRIVPLSKSSQQHSAENNTHDKKEYYYHNEYQQVNQMPDSSSKALEQPSLLNNQISNQFVNQRQHKQLVPQNSFQNHHPITNSTSVHRHHFPNGRSIEVLQPVLQGYQFTNQSNQWHCEQPVPTNTFETEQLNNIPVHRNQMLDNLSLEVQQPTLQGNLFTNQSVNQWHCKQQAPLNTFQNQQPFITPVQRNKMADRKTLKSQQPTFRGNQFPKKSVNHYHCKQPVSQCTFQNRNNASVQRKKILDQNFIKPKQPSLQGSQTSNQSVNQWQVKMSQPLNIFQDHPSMSTPKQNKQMSSRKMTKQQEPALKGSPSSNQSVTQWQYKNPLPPKPFQNQQPFNSPVQNNQMPDKKPILQTNKAKKPKLQKPALHDQSTNQSINQRKRKQPVSKNTFLNQQPIISPEQKNKTLGRKPIEYQKPVWLDQFTNQSVNQRQCKQPETETTLQNQQPINTPNLLNTLCTNVINKFIFTEHSSCPSKIDQVIAKHDQTSAVHLERGTSQESAMNRPRLPGSARKRLLILIADGKYTYEEAFVICQKPWSRSSVKRPNINVSKKYMLVRNDVESTSMKNPTKTSKMLNLEPLNFTTSGEHPTEIINVGIWNSESMSEEQMDLVKLDLNRSILFLKVRAKYKGSGPRFLGISFKDGWILVTCQNRETLEWLKYRISMCSPWPEANLSVIQEDKLPKWVASTLITLSDVKNASKALELIWCQNMGLNPECWKILSEKVDEDHIFVVYSIDEASAETLKRNNFQVHIGLNCFFFKLREEVYERTAVDSFNSEQSGLGIDSSGYTSGNIDCSRPGPGDLECEPNRLGSGSSSSSGYKSTKTDYPTTMHFNKKTLQNQQPINTPKLLITLCTNVINKFISPGHSSSLSKIYRDVAREDQASDVHLEIPQESAKPRIKLSCAARKRLTKLMADGKYIYEEAIVICQKPWSECSVEKPNVNVSRKRKLGRNFAEGISDKNPINTPMMSTATLGLPKLALSGKNVTEIIHVGIWNLEPMSEEQMALVKLYLNRCIFCLKIKVTYKGCGPRFLGISFKDGWILVTCQNRETLEWLKIQISMCSSWPEANLSVMQEDELPKWVASTFVPLLDAKSASKALELIWCQNKGLNPECWKILIEKVEKNHIFVVYSIDEASVETLRSNNFKVYIGMTSLFFKLRKETYGSATVDSFNSGPITLGIDLGGHTSADTDYAVPRPSDLHCEPSGLNWPVMQEGESPKQWIASTMIPLSDAKSASKALELIWCQNRGLNPEYWQILFENEEQNHIYAVYSLDEASVEILRNNKFKVNIGLNSLLFKLKGEKQNTS